MTEIDYNNIIKKLDGREVKCVGNMDCIYIYNDYLNTNCKILDEYDLDLKIFYNELPTFDNIIEEIPMDKLSLIVNKAGEIIENSKVGKDMVFDINNINKFISISVNIIESNLRELKIEF